MLCVMWVSKNKTKRVLDFHKKLFNFPFDILHKMFYSVVHSFLKNVTLVICYAQSIFYVFQEDIFFSSFLLLQIDKLSSY